MKTANRWAAIALAAVFLITGGLLMPRALAESGTEKYGVVDINKAMLGFVNHAKEYGLDGDYAAVQLMDASDWCDQPILDYVAGLAFDENGSAKLAEALARNAGLPSTGMQLSQKDEEMIAILASRDSYELKVICGLVNYIKRDYEAWSVGATIAPTLPPTPVPNEKQDPDPVVIGEGEGTRVILAHADVIGYILESFSRSDNQDIQRLMVEYFNSLSLDEQIAVLAYLQKRMEKDAYTELAARLAAAYVASGLEMSGSVALAMEGGMIGDPSAAAQETAPTAGKADAPTEPAPLTDENLEELGDTVITSFGLDDEQRQQELTAWFLSLSADDQTAIMNNVVNKLDEKGGTEFRAWMMGVFSSPCTTEDQSAAESLNLRGKDWNALTLHGLPAPARGKLQKTAAVDNKRSGRQTVLAGVTQEAFEAWLEQLSQEAAFAEWPDADGKDFDNNFGPSFSSGLTDSGGKSTTVYCRQEGANGNVDIRIDYLYTDQTLSVTVLEP